MGPGVACECIEARTARWSGKTISPEIVDPDTGAVLPDGAEGELVFTSLSKEALPIVRYRTRDLTRPCRPPRARSCAASARSSAAATTC